LVQGVAACGSQIRNQRKKRRIAASNEKS